MKLVILKQKEHLINVKKKLELYLKLTNMLYTYDENFEKHISELADMECEQAKKFKNIALGLRGLNTREMSIANGQKYLTEFIVTTIKELNTIYELTSEDAKENILQDNFDNCVKELLDPELYDKRLSTMDVDLAKKEFAESSLIKFLQPYSGKDIENGSVADWLRRIIDEISNYKNTELKSTDFNNERVEAFLLSTIKSIKKSIDDDSLTLKEISTLDNTGRDISVALPEDINDYEYKVTLKQTKENVVDLTKELYGVVRDAESYLEDSIKNISKLDFKLLSKITPKLKSINEDYESGLVTKDTYLKANIEYYNLLIMLCKDYNKLIDDHIEDTQQINKQINMVSMLKVLLERVIIEATIPAK